MTNSRRIMLAGAGGLLVLGLGASAFADGPRAYQVTVTNLTANQTFTPLVVASHRAGVKLFEPGSPASVPLEQLAEGGATGPLAAMLMANPAVGAVATGGPVPPGASTSVVVMAQGNFTHVSVAAMLVPTNDGFFAVNGVEVGNANRTVTLYSPAYDAGTELNDELCANIPGGDGCSGEGFNPSRAGAEGYVHVHRGIHGVGNLSPAIWDWRNPVARITIARVD